MGDDEVMDEKFQRFLGHYFDQPEHTSKINNLVRFLNGQPDYLKPLDLVPIDNLEQRLPKRIFRASLFTTIVTVYRLLVVLKDAPTVFILPLLLLILSEQIIVLFQGT